MQAISNIFGSILKFIYDTLSNSMAEPKSISFLALSILTLTLIYKVLTIPVTINSIKTQRINEKMAPEMKAIQKKYKNDPQTQQIKIRELQQAHGFNPLSSCLPLIIQMFLIFALFRVMRNPGEYMFQGGGFDQIAKNFLWIKDLTKPDKYMWGMPLILAVTQYLIAAMTMPSKPKETNANNEPDPMQGMNASMKYVMPIMMFFFARSYQAGLALYWGFGNILELIIRLAMKKFAYQEEDQKYAKETLTTKKDKKKDSGKGAVK